VDKVIFAKASDRSYLYPDRIFANFIKPLIWEGFTCSVISKHCNMQVSTVKRFVKIYGTENDINKFKDNTKQVRSNIFRVIGHSKKDPYDACYPFIKQHVEEGYTGNEIIRLLKEKHNTKIARCTLVNVVKRHKDKKIINKLYRNGKIRVREVSRRNSLCFSSKIEKIFRSIIKKHLPTVKGNYRILGSHGFYWLVDVALPSDKIAFEYDGICWHNKERDRKRDEDLASKGWQVIRFPYGPTPKKEVLEQDFLNKARELNLL
jgi:hypothetical protein